MLSNKLVFMAFVLVFLFAASSSYAAVVFDLKIDDTKYTPSENITISGSLWDNTSLMNVTSFTITIYNATDVAISATTSANGSFSVSYNLSGLSLGEHNLTASYSSYTSNNITFTITRIANVVGTIVQARHDLNLSSNWGLSYNWNETSLFNSSTTLDGITYYILVDNRSNAMGNYSCSDMFIDDDTNFTLNDAVEDTGGITELKYLTRGSKFTINDTTYLLVFVDPACDDLEFVQFSATNFSGGESRTIMARPLDTSGNGLSLENAGGSLTFEIYNDLGSLINKTTVNDFEMNYVIPTTTGRYFILVNGYSIASFNVKSFDMSAKILNRNGEEVYAVGAGEEINLSVSVLNSSTAASITSATVNATSGSGTAYNLTYDSSLSTYIAKINAPSSGSETYTIQVLVGQNTQRVILRISVKSFKLTTMAFAPQKGKGEGFATGSDAIIIISARNMTSGDKMNLSNLTSYCNSAYVSLKSFLNSQGTDLALAYDVTNITEMFRIRNPPSFVQDEMTTEFGSQACVINFATPGSEGEYTAIINVTVAGTTELSYTPITIQELFVSASPMSAYDSFMWYVSPGETVYLSINAFDGTNGVQIPAANITSVSIVEVMSEEGVIVTPYMLNESFSNSMTIGTDTTRYAAISFVVNDSYMGFHDVEFKIKANVSRNASIQPQIIEAVGHGWFMEKKYHVFAYPVSGGGRWYFGSTDNITLRVEVYTGDTFASFGEAKNENDTTSGSASLSNILVSIDEVRETFTWKKVGFSSSSTQTNEFGKATLTLNYTGTGWSTGNYNVRVKISDSSNVVDYGFAWLQIQNFMFWGQPNTWEASLGVDLNITGYVKYANWSNIQGAAVNITKILYHGSGDEWVMNEISYDTSSNTINGTTAANGQATVTVPSSALSKTGNYEVILSATLADGTTQTSRAWFNVKSFVFFVRDTTREEMWNPSYAQNAIVLLNVTAGDKFDYGLWPIPISGSKNISAVWITRIEKDGMMGPFMKDDDDAGSQNIGQNYTCTGITSSCILTFSTTGLDTGMYHMSIVANDTGGNKEENWLSFTIRSFQMTSPELKRVRVDTAYPYTNATSIVTGTSWSSCSGGQLTAPPGVSECKAIATYYFTNDETAVPYAVLIDLNSTNLEARKVYINASGADSAMNFNTSLANSTVIGYSVGQLFRINNSWFNVTSISSTVLLESNNTVGYDGSNDGKWDYNSEAAGCQDASCTLYTNDSTGTYYLIHKRWTCWECFADNDWLGIDLNGDGNYFQDDDDSYYLAVQVKEGQGITSVYTGSTSDLRTSTTHIYPSSTRPANVTATGTPIRYIGASYTQSGSGGGSDTGNTYIEVTFTSNKTGWNGMEIGTFKQGSNVTIPVMVLDPAGTRVANAEVNISSAVLMEQGPPMEVILTTSAIAYTDALGIAMLQLNTSWFRNPMTGGSTGKFAMKASVNSSGQTAQSTGDPWEWPKITIANFELRIEPGIFGTIDGLKRLHSSLNTLTTLNTYEAPKAVVIDLRSNFCGDANVYGTSRWMYSNVYVNTSYNASRIIVDTDRDCILEPGTDDAAYSKEQNIAISKGDHTLFFKFDNVALGSTLNFSLNCTNCEASNVNEFSRYFEIGSYRYYLQSVACNPAPIATVIRTELSGNWWVTENVGIGDMNSHEDYTVLNITTSGNCSLGQYYNASLEATMSKSFAAMSNPWNLSLGGGWKILKVANGSATVPYQLLLYDDSSVKNGENQVGIGQSGSELTALDRVAVINSAGTIVNTYYVGDYINEINLTLFGGRLWENRAYLTNYTDASYPLLWFCDGTEDFWYGNFSEADVGKDLNSEMYMGPEEQGAQSPNASQYYYLMMFDQTCNGRQTVDGGTYDDDKDLMELSYMANASWIKVDLYGNAGKSGGAPTELGSTLVMGNGQPEQFGERWFSVGQDRWPIQFVSFNTSDNANGTMDVQVMKEMFASNETPSYLIKASTLDGTTFNGNASVTSVINMRTFAPVAAPNDTATITNGIGVLRLNSFNPGDGGYIIAIKVCDTSNVCETAMRPVFIGTMDMKMEKGPGGGGPAP